MTTIVVMKRLVLAFALTLIPVSAALAQLQLVSQADSPSLTDSTLVSPSTGVDYAPLRNLLKAEKWRQANEKTAQLMLQAAKRDSQGWVSPEDIKALACWDLKTVDELWKEYSKGRFGFSVQFPIFIATGNKPGKLLKVEAYEAFGDRVGWRKDGQWIQFIGNLDYSLDAPTGHLPNPRPAYQITGGRLQYVNLAQRMIECQIVPALSKPPK